MSLCVILKGFDWKAVLLISNQLFTEDSLMIHFYKQHKNVKFTSEIEENGSLSFLDITITLENKKFVTSVYRKPTFSSAFINFESFIPEMHKRGLFETFFHKSFRLCSSYEDFHQEIKITKSIFKHNNYPQNFVNQCIKRFLNKVFIKKDISWFLKGN